MKTRMRRTATATLAAASVVAAVAAVPSIAATPKPTGPPSSWTVSEDYLLPAYETSQTILGTVHVGGGEFAVPSWARYISVQVADDSGLPTDGDIWLETRSTDHLSELATFCGRTTRSYPIDPSVIGTIWVDLSQGPCNDGTVAAGTAGTVSVTFTS